jgi:hypothetical protein
VGQNSDPETVAQAMYEMNTTDLRMDLARIKAPTLVIGTWIGYQQYTSRERVEKVFKSNIQNSKVFNLPCQKQENISLCIMLRNSFSAKWTLFLLNKAGKIKNSKITEK